MTPEMIHAWVQAVYQQTTRTSRAFEGELVRADAAMVLDYLDVHTEEFHPWAWQIARSRARTFAATAL